MLAGFESDFGLDGELESAFLPLPDSFDDFASDAGLESDAGFDSEESPDLEVVDTPFPLESVA